MPDETTLAQVFAKTPPFTEAELTLVISKFRESREQFLLGAKAPKAAKKVKGEKPSIDLDSIEL